MAYEHQSDFNLSDFFGRNDKAQEHPTTLYDLRTPFPETYGEILKDVDPAVVDFAFLGTAILLRTSSSLFSRGKNLWRKLHKNFLSKKQDVISLEGLGFEELKAWRPLSDENPFEGSILNEVRRSEWVGLDKKEPDSSLDTPEIGMTDEAFQAIKKLVDDNESRRFKMQKDWKTPSLSDADAKFLNGVAGEIEKYVKKQNISSPPGASFRRSIHLSAAGAPIIDGLRFLPKDKIDELRKLIKPEMSDKFSVESKLGFLGND